MFGLAMNVCKYWDYFDSIPIISRFVRLINKYLLSTPRVAIPRKNKTHLQPRK